MEIERRRVVGRAGDRQEGDTRGDDRAARLRELDAAFDEAHTREDVARTAVDAALEAFGAIAGSFAAVSGGGDDLEVIYAVGAGSSVLQPRRRVPIGLDTPMGLAARARGLLIADSAAEVERRFPPAADEARPHQLGAVAVTPVEARGRLLGVLGLGFRAPSSIHGDDRLLFTAFALQCGQALERARLSAAERGARRSSERAAERLQRLQSVSAALSGALTSDQVADVVVSEGIATLDARSASLAVLDAAGTTLEIMRAVGYPAGAVGQYARIPLDAVFPLSDAARTGKPVLLETAASGDARYPELEDLQRGNGGAMVALPLTIDGRAIGAIGFNFADRRWLEEDDSSYLHALAQQCAQALDRARLHEAELRSSEETAAALSREATLLETITDGFIAVDACWRLTYVNPPAAAMAGRPCDDLLGRSLWDVLAGRADDRMSRTLGEARARQAPASGEALSTSTDRWLEYRAYPSGGGLSLFLRDITERKWVDESTRFLAEASSVLASSLDYETTLANVARLAVPAVASTCVIDLVNERGELERVASVFESEEIGTLAHELNQRYPLHAGSTHPARRVLATGESIYYPDIPPDALSEVVDQRPESLALARRLSPTSCVFVALRARGRTLGVMSLATAGSRRRLGTRDRALCEDLALRAATAVDNARLHEAERRARADAEAANRAKSDFLAVMSHELRTPLTAVVGYTELIAEGVVGPVNETQLDHLSRVRSSSEHLLMLIEDILSYSRIEAGREHVVLEQCSLAGLLDQAATIVRPLAEKKSLELRVSVSDPSAVVHSDAQKLRQILINLLANAVKFTDAGYVSVSGDLADGGVVITVADSGAGIASEHSERVFDAFWQVDQRMTRRAGGTGLGLSVARKLARLLGGDLTLESALGKGSVFSLTLPSAPEGAARAPDTPHHP